MAAFDLNSLYFLKNAAPKTSSFEELNAPMERGFNLGRAYNENYNKNSLQNLIAQREAEGVPYDRLSNEAAKWDIGAAQAMRNERRSSLKYNYEQSVAEFERWRKNMARRICGLILQKADELGIAPEELDRVLNIAASYVVTYDEALAQWLLGQAGTRRAAQGRLNRNGAKPIVDHEKEISATMEKASQPTGDAESDPNAMRFRTHLKRAASRLLQWKNENPYDFATNPNGRTIWKRMLSAFEGIDDPLKLSDDKVTALVQNLTGEGDGTENDALNEVTPENNPAPTPSGNIAPASSGNGGKGVADNFGLNPIWKYSGTTSGAKVINPKTLGELSNFVEDLKPGDDAEFSEKAKAARKILAEGAGIKDADVKSETIKPIIDRLKEKEAEHKGYVKELEELGVKNPEDAFMKFRKLFGQRAGMQTVIQFRNFNSFVNSYISNAPTTAISNGLLVGTPGYKPTLGEIKAAKNVHGDWSNALKTTIQNTGLPFASQIASYATDYDALQALGQDVEKQIRGLWNSVSAGLSPEEKAKLRKLYTELFHIDKKAWEIIDGKSFPRGAEYDRQLKAMNKKSNSSSNSADLSGSDELNNAPAKYKETDWDNF